MELMIYVALLLPAAIMILAGLLVNSARQDDIMTSHHFAADFNIKRSSRRVMSLFTVCGLIFSFCGLIIMRYNILAGFLLLAATVVVFIVLFSTILKKG